MSEQDTTFEAAVEAMAALLGLQIADQDRPGVVSNLRVTAGLAKLVLEFPIDDHAEPAPVFRA